MEPATVAMNGSLRIIAGTWRSRRLLRPETGRTRPMPDRVKAAIFSMLGSHYDVPGRLPAVCVADVFAGSGSMGLEALSRGADCCWFFERDRDAVAVLRKNCESLGAVDRCRVVVGDAWLLAGAPPPDGPFDLVLLDPPYRDSADSTEPGTVRRFLSRLAETAGNGRVVALHHPAHVRYTLPSDGAWRTLKARTFGTNGITLLARS
jgi:16S rRNA (guanine(966)-N(2))-methyltransferase RsmD